MALRLITRQQITNARRGPHGPRRMIPSFPALLTALWRVYLFENTPALPTAQMPVRGPRNALRTAKERAGAAPYFEGTSPAF